MALKDSIVITPKLPHAMTSARSPKGNPHEARKIKNRPAAMRRNRYQPGWLLDFCEDRGYPALPAAVSPINAFPREDGSPPLVQFGAALGAAPSASAEWHAFARPVAFA